MKERLSLLPPLRHRSVLLPLIGAASLLWYNQNRETVACEWRIPFFETSSPRLPHTLRPNDPIWSLTARQQRQRERDEAQQKKILAEIQTITSGGKPASFEERNSIQKRLAALQQRWLDTVYGRNVSLQERRDFLEQYGCTGYTDEVLDVILAIGTTEHSGIVEMGAGNGQWARALSDRYKLQKRKATRGFQIVLAYDNNAQLPLDPTVYHAKTQPAHDFFYPAVQPLLSNNTSIEHTLQQWSCRGRALLLVYPPPKDDMALRAVQAYSQLPQAVHTIVYVGEGPGGATANDAFFQWLEDEAWTVVTVLPVRSFGTKGYEKMYVLRKEKPGHT